VDSTLSPSSATTETKESQMKTALVQTNFWKDEEIFALNLDTKLLYIFYMTCPERNCTRFYRCPDRLTSAYIGLTDEALAVCKRQLELGKLMYFKKGWVIIGNACYVKPTRGKLSQKLFAEDLAKVPGEIIDFALTLGLDCSGATQEYIDNNKDNNKDKAKDRDKNKEINKTKTLGSILKSDN
jgi:hypothetical protein